MCQTCEVTYHYGIGRHSYENNIVYKSYLRDLRKHVKLDRHWIYKYSRRRGAICPGHLASPLGLPDCNPITSHTFSLSTSTPSLALSFCLFSIHLCHHPSTPTTPLFDRHWVSCNLDRVTRRLFQTVQEFFYCKCNWKPHTLALCIIVMVISI